MNDGYAWWLLIAGVGIGVGLAWLIIGRLPRNDDDLAVGERLAEASWISRSITGYGGVAPQPLVEEILDLHRHYLDSPGLDPDRWAAYGSPPDEDAPDPPAHVTPPTPGPESTESAEVTTDDDPAGD